MVFTDFDEAASHKKDGEVVCGVLMEDGTARYFLADADTSDDEMRERSFQIRNGEPMTPYQRWIMQKAMEMGRVPA